jgi:hypothetical protein
MSQYWVEEYSSIPSSEGTHREICPQIPHSTIKQGSKGRWMRVGLYGVCNEGGWVDGCVGGWIVGDKYSRGVDKFFKTLTILLAKSENNWPKKRNCQ